MCDTLLLLCICVFTLMIHLYLCDSDIYMIVICDMCSLLWFLNMSYHLYYAHLPLLPHLYSDANEPCYVYLCLIHIFWVHCVGLGHISLPNPFVLIHKSLYEPSISKTSLFYILEVVLSSMTKNGEIESI